MPNYTSRRSHPSSFGDLPPGLRPHNRPDNKGGVGKSPSFEKQMSDAGISVAKFLELAKRDPTTAKVVGEQIKKFIDSGAPRKEIAEFFRNQSQVSIIVAEVVEGSDDWKIVLEKIRNQVPKAN